MMLETSNPLLVGNRVTVWGSRSIAAFLLDIDWSEGPLRSDSGVRPVILKGRTIRVDPAQNLWEACSVMKNSDCQSRGVKTLGETYGDHHSAAFRSP